MNPQPQGRSMGDQIFQSCQSLSVGSAAGGRKGALALGASHGGVVVGPLLVPHPFLLTIRGQRSQSMCRHVRSSCDPGNAEFWILRRKVQMKLRFGGPRWCCENEALAQSCPAISAVAGPRGCNVQAMPTRCQWQLRRTCVERVSRVLVGSLQGSGVTSQ